MFQDAILKVHGLYEDGLEVCRKSKVAKIAVAGATAAATFAPMVVFAEPTVTVPDVDTTITTSAGTKVFAAVALVTAIGLGYRMFKKA